VRRLALLLALVPAPALAEPDDLLECATARVTPAFRDKIADAMLAEESEEGDALFAELARVADECVTRFALPADKGEAYFAYTVARLPHDAFTARLGQAGISAAVLDEALDFGAGRTNPVITGDLAPDQVEKLVAALAANGVDVEAVPQASWELVGAYAAATSLLWQSRAKLP
jgi:phage terminase large subunit-like protein